MSPNRVLVVFASEHGSTAGIARALARELQDAGIEVDCLPAGEVRDVSPYAGVILGSGVFLPRRGSDGQGFLPRHADALRERRLWLFVAGPLGRTASRGPEAAGQERAAPEPAGREVDPAGRDVEPAADPESPLVQVARRVGADGTAIFGSAEVATFAPGDSPMRERERVRGWARAIASQLAMPRTHLGRTH